MVLRSMAAAFAAVVFLFTGADAIARQEDSAKQLLGAWEGIAAPGDKPSIKFIELQAAKMAMYAVHQGQGQLAFASVTYQPGKVLAKMMGTKLPFAVEVHGQELTLRALSGPFAQAMPGPMVFRKLPKTPPELEVKPLELGKPENLMKAHPEKNDLEKAILDIGKELDRRLQIDQAVRTDPQRQAEMPKVDAENTTYLLGLVKDYGWVDVQHFGAPASNAAFLLVQHSGNLSLMATALPLIKEDVLAKRLDGQPYALLYDRLKLFTGEKQRYGTQIGTNEKGEMVVNALENRSKVDEFRKELGLPPLSAYLEHFQSQGKIVFEDD